MWNRAKVTARRTAETTGALARRHATWGAPAGAALLLQEQLAHAQESVPELAGAAAAVPTIVAWTSAVALAFEIVRYVDRRLSGRSPADVERERYERENADYAREHAEFRAAHPDVVAPRPRDTVSGVSRRGRVLKGDSRRPKAPVRRGG